MPRLLASPLALVSATRYAGATGYQSARLAWTAAAGAATVARAVGTAAVAQAAQRPGPVLAAMADVGAGRHVRRVWTRSGHAHVEVRGLSGRGARHQKVAGDVTEALGRLEGVHWAQVNSVTRQVLLAFNEDAIGLDQIVSVIESVEEQHGTDDGEFAAAGTEVTPEHPADDTPIAVTAVALATDLAGLALAGAGRMMHVGLLPRSARLPLLIANTHPWARRRLERRLGHLQAELLVALGTAGVNAASLGPGPLAVDSVHQALRLTERLGRRSVWRRREPELVGDGVGLGHETPDVGERPQPLPEGPVERLADETALASLLEAAGALAFARDPGRAAELMLTTMPMAGRQGRDAYVAMLGWNLTRHGAVPMDGTALHRLDRVDTVVIDSAALLTAQRVVLQAEVAGRATKMTDADVWRIAEQLIAPAAPEGREAGAKDWRLRTPRSAKAKPQPQPGAEEFDLVDRSGHRRGRVALGHALDPLAEALLEAAHQAADRILLSHDASTAELVQWADDVLPANEDLHPHIRRLQNEGRVVLLVSGADEAALAAADVGVAVLAPTAEGAGPAASSCWSGDLITGPGLAEAWRVVNAVPTAKAVSRRSSRLALGGAALGALLTVRGGRRRTRVPRIQVSPVHSAAMAALLAGAYSGLRCGRQDLPEGTSRAPWHALTAQDVYNRLLQSRRDADREAAAARRAPAPVRATRAAASRVAAFTPVRVSGEFAQSVADELRDPLTPVLALGAAASAVVGSSIDAFLVSGVMGGNAIISAGQQMRARKALRRLMLGERPAARLARWEPLGLADEGEDWIDGLEDARTRSLPAARLRLGDVIVLRSGDVIPADARLIRAEELEVDESALTGESLPVAKSVEPTPGADLSERACMVYEGCVVVAGTGYAVVSAVGAKTEAGRATAAAGTARAPRAGIQARLVELTRIALPATAIGGGAVTALAAVRGVPLRQALASGVAVAVAAVPEGLPLVATVAQLAAARRLSGKGVLVRSANALEALGRVDTVCFDKTGTLTEGRLSVARIAAFDEVLPADRSAVVLHTAACACPDPGDEKGATRSLVHPTDIAVVQAAREHPAESDAWERVAELPFETTRGYSAGLCARDGHRLLAVKGAPETVLELCVTVHTEKGDRKLTRERRSKAAATLRQLADDGLRVLAVARRELDGQQLPDDAQAQLAEQVRELTLLGFVAIADTVRPSAAETVRLLTEAGVRTVMITGDHPRTAVAIARQLDIPDTETVLTGAELDRLPKTERDAKIAASTVFARVSPQHKVRIIQALQGAGRVVAMAGDGSNDAAAIRLADVGVALGGAGSRPARNAADLVLAEPDPVGIVAALQEGRALWRSVRDAVAILVGGNAGEIAFTLLGTAIGGRAPLGTRQFLLVNMMTDMLPALAVALAPARPAAEGAAQGPDSAPVPGTWGPELVRDLAARGGATALGAMLAWQAARATGRERRASTASLAALVITQLGQTAVTSRHSPLVLATCVGSAAMLFAVVETPGVSQFFGCTPLGPVAWTMVGASAATATAAGALAPALIEKIAAHLHPTKARMNETKEAGR
ncbi:cation-translocating P-type ATPase [Actinospica robiniae]|uniref:cation-translocating P-type ATPase n=1 Tax=Actinospica robiniae TaxID=304901 RepID=UPI000688834F|nr:cation-translocating P-type ATPase [Actinospica robiniae]